LRTARPSCTKARDDCTVEAGLYLTAGTIVTLPDGQRLKARELNGQAGWLFRRNSRTGSVEALDRSGTWTGLNIGLHESRQEPDGLPDSG
jgi:2,3,4,5-tetrahydropyridine-2,6-dicarboxylate N-succinyltransferase